MLKEDHKEIASGKKKDDEGYMARNELDTIERQIKNLRRVIKSGDTQLPAWVQSKITKAADYIDTAAEYLQSDEKIDEGKQISFAVKKSSGAGALTPDAAKQLGDKAVKLQKAKAAAVSLPSVKKEEISLVEKILGEEKCGKGMYWCNTDKVCKPLPDGFNVDGQKKKPTEVGIGKPVGEETSCNHTKKGKSCPIHGMNDCSIKEEKDPKGPVKSYKSPIEIAKKHKVSVEEIKKQLEMGIKVEGEHTSNKSSARITALQHLDEVPDYYTKLKKVETVKEAVRLKPETGNILLVTLSWRGKYHSVKMFFPQVKYPNRKDVTDEINKIYPGSRVVSFSPSELPVGDPIIKVYGGSHGFPGPSKNYVKTMGEQVEIEEDWQKSNRKDGVDGLSQSTVNAYRKENPGSKLQTAVTEKNPEGKRAQRRKNFCSRMGGMKKRLTSAKTAKDPDSKINKALRRWRCN